MCIFLEYLDCGFRLIREKLNAKSAAMLPSMPEVEVSIQLREAEVLSLKQRLEKVEMKQRLGSLRRKDILPNKLKGQSKLS